MKPEPITVHVNVEGVREAFEGIRALDRALTLVRLQGTLSRLSDGDWKTLKENEDVRRSGATPSARPEGGG